MVTDAELIKEMQDGEQAPEPGTFNLRNRAAIIASPDGELPAPMVMDALDSAGYTYIYRISNGERTAINNNLMSSTLGKRDEQGRHIFSLDKRDVPEWVPGGVKCFLHEDDPNRAEYARQGFQACPAGHLASEYVRGTHMLHRHPAEQKAIQYNRDAAERAAQAQERLRTQKFQEVILARAAGDDSDEIEDAIAALEPLKGGCMNCNDKFEAETREGITEKIRVHMEAKHPEA
jgi:hypothetical protein